MAGAGHDVQEVVPGTEQALGVEDIRSGGHCLFKGIRCSAGCAVHSDENDGVKAQAEYVGDKVGAVATDRPGSFQCAHTAVARILKALSDPNRLRLLSIVKAGDGGEACVCDLTEPLDLGQPTVSHHLKILVDAGLLEREKRGTWAYYSLVPGALERAATIITGL